MAGEEAGDSAVSGAAPEAPDGTRAPVPPPTASRAGRDAAPVRPWRRVLGLAGWIAAAIAAPMVAAVILHFARMPSAIREIVGLGSLTAMMVLLLAGIRSGRLAGWVLGPSIGFGLGILAQKAVYWPVHAGWSPRSVALLPLWGVGVGLAAGIASGSWRRAATLPLLVGALHFGGLCAWLILGSLPGFKDNLLGNLRWLLESLAYAPAAIAVVLAMPRQR